MFLCIVFTCDQIILNYIEGKTPPSFRGHSANYIKNTETIIIYGGITGFGKYNENTYQIDFKSTILFYFYDREISLIKVNGPIPLARAFHSSILIEERSSIVYYGGLMKNENSSNEIIIYNVKSYCYNLIKASYEPLPYLFGHKMVRIKDTVYVLGGVDSYSALCNILLNSKQIMKKEI